MGTESEETRSPRLTRGEYWLLECCVEHHVAVNRVLLDAELCTGAYNRAFHGLGPDDLVDTLRRMRRRGWIVFEGPRASVPFRLRSLIGRMDKEWYYRLTPRGGRVWGAFARPDWTRHVREEYRFTGKTGGVGVLRGLNRHRLVARIGYLPLFGRNVDPRSLRWSQIAHRWRPVYWRWADGGTQVAFLWTRGMFQRDMPVSAARSLEWYSWH